MKVIAAHQVRFAPQRCAVIPYIGPSRGGRFIDTGMSLVDGFQDRVYVSEHAVREMANLLGFPDRGEYRQAVEERDRLRARVAELEEQVGQMSEFMGALDVIESEGFRARRKPGPRKEKVA